MKLPNLNKFSEEKKNELIARLEKVCDCEHFIYGTFIDLDSDADIDKVLEYIDINPNADSSDIIVFTFLLRKQR